MATKPTSRNPGNRRAVEALRAHRKTSVVPPLSADEFASLRQDIADRGIQEPLSITGSDILLDGRARLALARELDLGTVPVRVVDPSRVGEFIILAALSRRQLEDEALRSGSNSRLTSVPATREKRDV